MTKQRDPASLVTTLTGLAEVAGLRALPAQLGGVDFCSNDYLGLARTPFNGAEFQGFLEQKGGGIGATGSRLISGNRDAVEELEIYLSDFHSTEAALVFNSGFEANTALVGALSDRTTTMLYDERVHASMREGLRVGLGRSFSFAHNNLTQLEELHARVAKGDTYVLVESLYSMDGDVAPLVELAHMAERLGFFLIVDEAHSTGVYGDSGEGLVQQLQLQEKVFARVHTFGKAVGFRGACLVGSRTLINFIVNRARPFIYSTAPDLFSLYWTRTLYDRMRQAHRERAMLRKAIEHMQIRMLDGSMADGEILSTASPIQAVLVRGNARVVALEQRLIREGVSVKAIRSPTVPAGRERIRISVHAFNTTEEIDTLCSIVAGALGAWRKVGNSDK